MKKFIIISFIMLSLCESLYSQVKDSVTKYPDIQSRELQIIQQQWLNTNNAAGLAFSNVTKGSFTSLERFVSRGDYHRAQEGSSNKALRFSTQRYDRFNEKIYVRGSFSFLMNNEGDRAWSDVIKTYNSNPYIYGSSVKGDYQTQKFDLNLKIYTIPMGKFNFGVTVDYHVSDISRQRDPRSRSYSLDYSIIPSLTYAVSKSSKVGVDLYYRFDKEKMPGLTTVQTDPNLKYYTFSGMESAIGRIGGYRGFSRQFVSDYIGGSLQYNYANEKVKFLLSAGMDAQWQETLGDKKQSPGSYNSFNYRLVSNLLIEQNNFLHNFTLTALIKDGGADEHRQNLISTRDTLTGISTETWVTIYTYKNRFVVKTSDINASWKTYSRNASGKGYRWSAGIFGGYNHFSNTYYLPKSEIGAGKFYGGAEGSYLLFSRNETKLEFEGFVKAGFKTDSYLLLASQNEISENILIPDIEYHRRNSAEIYGSLRYIFPMKFAKRTKLTGYAKVYGGNIFATDSKNWSNAGVAIGLLTF
ncbi:MAG: hypothetical protein Q8S04_09005 [Bacteroidales bacterium]|nr:hypothetical protein [Bacteroidales bacterium]